MEITRLNRYFSQLLLLVKFYAISIANKDIFAAFPGQPQGRWYQNAPRLTNQCIYRRQRHLELNCSFGSSGAEQMLI